MKHAGPAALATLEPLPGVFYLGSRAFLHFHEDPAWLRSPVDTAGQQRDLLSRIAADLRRRGRKR
jgi:hypothetical protein